MTLLAGVAKVLPWWAKIGAKVVLARLPLGGRAWQTLGLFSPGGMRRVDYAFGVFESHFKAAGRFSPGFTFLELGPGDSLASAIIGRGHGAARSWLIDSGAYASRDMRFYRALIRRLESSLSSADLTALTGALDVESLLEAVNATYFEEGLASLRTIPDAACDFIFSNAVLEHVSRHEFRAMLIEIFRILKPGGVSTHEVDFRDHLGGGFNNLRFSDKVWEAPWFAKRSGFYTNRIRFSEMLTVMQDVGFTVTVPHTSNWEYCPLTRRQLAPAFRTMCESDRLTRDALFVLHKSG